MLCRATFVLLLPLFCVACAIPNSGRAQAPSPTQAASNLRQDFLQIIDRPRVPLVPEIQDTSTANGLIQIHFTFASEKEQRVPGILLKSASSTGKRPAVISMHGTGGNKSDQLPFLRQLANAGFVAIAIDGRYHGERAAAAPKEGNLNAYETAILRAWRGPKEHPLFYDTAWDIMRLVDYLQTRDDIDAARIGVYGVSKGGIETYFAAAADPRIAVAIPAIGVQTFQWGVDHNDWKGRVGTFQKAFDAAAKEAHIATADAAFVKSFYERLMPGVTSKFDGPSILPLITPRPLMVINSDSDNHTPITGVNLAADSAKAAYHQQNADDRFLLRIQPNTGHQVRPDSQRAAIEWFSKWLKP